MPHPPGNAGAASQEGDAFLARSRTRDVLLLMEGGPYSTRALGMRHPYRYAVPGQRAFHQGHPLGIPCSEGRAPNDKRALRHVGKLTSRWVRDLQLVVHLCQVPACVTVDRQRAGKRLRREALPHAFAQDRGG